MSRDRLVVGTSDWGWPVSFHAAAVLAQRIHAAGFRNFDTAPTYGAGYAEAILAAIGNHCDTQIATKFGRLSGRSARVLAKKILGAPNIMELRRSFRTLQSRNRLEPEFWNYDQLASSLARSKAKTQNPIARFFLQSPPIPVIEMGIYASALRLKSDGLVMQVGVSEPCAQDLACLKQGSPPPELLQLSAATLVRHPWLAESLSGTDVWVNGIFRTLRNNEDRSWLKSIFRSNPAWRAVVGVSRASTADQLPALHASLFG